MNSKIPDDLFSAFLDREATPAEEAEVKARLQASPQAKQELQDFQRLSELLQELPRRTVPSEFAAAVMQRAERETLIPLDAAGIGNRDSHRLLSPRRAWILTGIGAVAASVAALFFVASPGKDKPVSVLALKESSAQPASRDNIAAVALGPAASPPLSQAQKPVAVASLDAASPAPPALGMKKASGGARGTTPAEEAETIAPKLVFPADLKTAQVGDAIEALENVGDQVAVVRLTVVIQTPGPGGNQSLLVRDSSRPVGKAEKDKLLKEWFADTKGAVSVEGQKLANAAGGLICVYVEGSREQLADVLKDVQNESQIQRAQLTNTISAAKLAEYANRPVAPPSQFGEHTAPRAQTVLNLPVATVDKIFADGKAGQKRAENLGWGPQKPSSAAVAGNSDAFEYKSLDKQTAGPAADARLPQQATADRLAVTRGQPTRPGGAQVVSTAQRSFQVFFVLDDQSIAQSESAVQPPAAPAQLTPERQSRVQTRRPVSAKRPLRHRPPVSPERTD
jgi:hypothetical protein